MALNAQDARLEESVPSGMRERIVEQGRAREPRRRERKSGGGDDGGFERRCGSRRKFLSRSDPGIRRAAGNGLVMRLVVRCRGGRAVLVTAALHIRRGTRVGLMPGIIVGERCFTLWCGAGELGGEHGLHAAHDAGGSGDPEGKCGCQDRIESGSAGHLDARKDYIASPERLLEDSRAPA